MPDSKTSQQGGKIVRDPEAVAIDQISRAMAKLESPESRTAVFAWFTRRFAAFDLSRLGSSNPPAA